MKQLNKKKAALWWRRLIGKANSNVKSLSLSSKGKTPRKFLIILPEHLTESDLASRFIFAMQNALGPSRSNQIKLLGPNGVGQLLDLDDYQDFILYSEDDLNRWGLPGKELIWTCEKMKVDAVLDLNQAFAPASATLAGAVSAPLKVGFYSEDGEKYFNIMIRRKGADLAESGFKEIFQILGLG